MKMGLGLQGRSDEKIALRDDAIGLEFRGSYLSTQPTGGLGGGGSVGTVGGYGYGYGCGYG